MGTDEDKGAKSVTEALQTENPLTVAATATYEELGRIKCAEEVLALRHERLKRSRWIAQVAQATVTLVALAGFFANAYQNYNNKKQSDARAAQESERWEKEFKRAQDADKYRAFFETSALATDTANPDKRLVGYALLKEFVDDKSYDAKAIIMLEESLALELRRDPAQKGADDERRLAVAAIFSALSQTSDCRALAQAARTVEKLTRHWQSTTGSGRGDAQDPSLPERSPEEMLEVYNLYVNRVVGRAALVCSTPHDFGLVRRPAVAVMLQYPALAGSTSKLRPADANRHLADLMRDGCEEEVRAGGLVDCTDLHKGYAHLCAEMKKSRDWPDESAACAAMGAN
jgi:hypothetical protein